MAGDEMDLPKLKELRGEKTYRSRRSFYYSISVTMTSTSLSWRTL
jgi:hypothetical protein